MTKVALLNISSEDLPTYMPFFIRLLNFCAVGNPVGKGVGVVCSFHFLGEWIDNFVKLPPKQLQGALFPLVLSAFLLG